MVNYNMFLFVCVSGLIACVASEVTKTSECGYCKCKNVQESPITASPTTETIVHVNCSGVTSGSGQIRVPNLTEYLKSNSLSSEELWIEFNGNGIRNISNLKLPNVKYLSISDNIIEDITKGVFSSMETLQFVSLARNQLNTISLDKLKGLKNVHVLDLSNNNLETIDGGTFIEMRSLTTLILAQNFIKTIGPNLFSGMEHLETLDLSRNRIMEFSPSALALVPGLKHLILTGNMIEDLKSLNLKNVPNLLKLDLSFNHIYKLDVDVFSTHLALGRLLLANNYLTSILSLPPNIAYLDISNNPILDLQKIILTIPQIEELHIYNTSLIEWEALTDFDQLQVLNISTNSLEVFQIKRLPKLRILDISNNSLTSVPDGITVDELPSLEEIYLDFNPIKNISFPTTNLPFEKLNVMSFCNNPALTVLNAGVFNGLFKNVDTLRLSNNPTLSKIHEEAFKGVKINKIDLNSNAFTSVSQTLLDWKTLQTVDLQDNPWHCECSLQWMLDIVVAKLYKADQELLYNLKCASPAIVAEKRMVHFYNWTKPAFCSGFEQLRMNPGQNDPSSSSWLGTSNAAIIVVCSLLGVLVLLVALGIFLQRKLSARRRIKNRRF
uniref:LRRCT domain-containing protein n=1 Tax=Timema monikensis TaxID=170555 RepID=A0A7R9HQJ1_9NEOP|nr:unnamed protein product [Timema monikensis]